MRMAKRVRIVRKLAEILTILTARTRHRTKSSLSPYFSGSPLTCARTSRFVRIGGDHAVR